MKGRVRVSYDDPNYLAFTRITKCCGSELVGLIASNSTHFLSLVYKPKQPIDEIHKHSFKDPVLLVCRSSLRVCPSSLLPLLDPRNFDDSPTLALNPFAHSITFSLGSHPPPLYLAAFPSNPQSFSRQLSSSPW